MAFLKEVLNFLEQIPPQQKQRIITVGIATGALAAGIKTGEPEAFLLAGSSLLIGSWRAKQQNAVLKPS